MSNASAGAGFESLEKLGHLRPWEVADANAAVRTLNPAALRRLMSRIANQVRTSLHEPLTPPDADLVLSTASNLGGIFADVKGARDIARAVDESARGWTLVLSALEGQSYDDIVTAIRSDAPASDLAVRRGTKASRVLVDQTAQIVRAYVSNNRVEREDLSQLIGSVRGALESGPASGPQGDFQGRLKPAVPIRKSILPDYLICLEDGRKYKSLKRHLRTKYNMSPSEYRAKWGLPEDYPMVAPAYSAARAAMAKKDGLGRAPQAVRGRRRIAAK